MYSKQESTIVRVCILVVCLLMFSFNYAQAAGNASVRVINAAGGGTVEMTVKNISDNQPAADGLITWSNIEAGQTVWKIADQYLEISQEDLPLFWGMQIYTDNENDSADPEYTGTLDPAGLVKIDNTLIALPMAWRITDQVLTGAGLQNPVERSDGSGFEDYLWHFFKDRNTPDDSKTTQDESFTDGEDYVTLWNQAGIAWNEGGKAHNPKKARIYLAAKFTMANVNAEYKTSMLTLEAYHEVSPFPIYLYKDAPKTEYPDEEGATLENHFSPSGWMNYTAGNPHISVDSKCTEVTPYSGTHCFKITWNGEGGANGWKWGGIMWLEPEDIWEWKEDNPDKEHPTHNGYDLRGADYLSFWARTDSDNQGLRIQTFIGNDWDSGLTDPEWCVPVLTTTWRQYTISLDDVDMSDTTGGLAVIFNDIYDPALDGCVIYLDEIKFDKS